MPTQARSCNYTSPLSSATLMIVPSSKVYQHSPVLPLWTQMSIFREVVAPSGTPIRTRYDQTYNRCQHCTNEDISSIVRFETWSSISLKRETSTTMAIRITSLQVSISRSCRAQGTKLQNLHFGMPFSATTAVRIFTDNGSGGFVTDLTFFGGNIG